MTHLLRLCWLIFNSFTAPTTALSYRCYLHHLLPAHAALQQQSRALGSPLPPLACKEIRQILRFPRSLALR